MKQLDSGYTYEVDNIKKDAWHTLMLEFKDASFYQTWSYGSVCWGEDSLSHLVLKRDGEVVSFAQARIIRLSLFRIGLAYISWGPVWRKKTNDSDLQVFSNMLRALRNEYSVRRGYTLKVIPKNFFGDDDTIKNLFEEEGFSWSPDPQKTVYLDITPPIEEIRRNLRPKWRQMLNRALKQQAEYKDRIDGDVHYNTAKIIREMMQRKDFVEFGSMEVRLSINNDLPDPLKLKFVYCVVDNEPAGVMGWFPIGTVGQPLVGATGDKALQLNGSYPLWWRMVEYYKDQGASCVDLGGISKERNPGGYLFKTGIAGEKRIEKHYVGEFHACDNRLSSFSFSVAMDLRGRYRQSLVKLNMLKKRLGRYAS